MDRCRDFLFPAQLPQLVVVLVEDGGNGIHLVKLLLRVPDERLREVDAFIQFVLSQSTVASPAPASLGGIWRGKGFEELGDIQQEIDQLRQQSGKDILDKY
mgnify:CR=1 FL=1